jgi:exosome complex exonuclease RRP6
MGFKLLLLCVCQARGLGITTRQITVKQGDLVASGDKKVGSEAVRIPKPQSTFPVPVDNSRGHFRPNVRRIPFTPSGLLVYYAGWMVFCVQITNKPNARQPLTDFPGPGPYPHPYEFEIQNLVYEPWMLARNDETEFIPLDVVPFMYVDTPEGLDQLVRALMHPDVKEVAIDLEAHSIRSFSGFCCLMQVNSLLSVPQVTCAYLLHAS